MGARLRKPIWLYIRAERDPPAAQAFRHGLVASAIYLQAYSHYRMIYPPDAADRFATAMTLQLGNLSELNGPNPVPKHLMDYWNNYEGVRVGREIAAREGSEITNDRLAEILAGEINASIRAPLGKSRFILFNGHDQHAIDFKDPRLEVDRYDVNRLPNEAWGIGPLPKPEGYIPPAIIEAFPNLYQNPAPTPSSSPQRTPGEKQDVPDPRIRSPDPSRDGDGRTFLDSRSDAQRLAAASRGLSIPLSRDGEQSDERPQPLRTVQSALPQHVVEAGNLLRANGYEITPRTMYLTHVLGPQGAVDLMKRTGSTGSPPPGPAPRAAPP